MTEPSTVRLRTTPLAEWHRSHRARMVPCAGWEMPAEYSGLADEHMAVRTRAGLFDLSHMGQIEVAGPNALAAVQKVSSNDASMLAVGQAHHAGLTTPGGTFVDDMLVYRVADEHFMLVVNAPTADKDAAWVTAQAAEAGDVSVVNTSDRYALVALQGPASRDVLQTLTGADVSELKHHWFTHGEVAGARATISRTGYTGEAGYEIFTPPRSAVRVWEAILAAGAEAGVVPAGLGARDTLRLEAGMRLHGRDIDETTTVVEAGLEGIVGWGKADFNGKAALAAQRQAGTTRRLVGFEMAERAIARHGCDVYVDGARAGEVTSGTQTPFVKKAIGMAYLPIDRTAPGTEFEIGIRGRRARARVVPLPFYKRPRG